MEKNILDKNLYQRLVFGGLYGIIVFCCTTPYVSHWLESVGIHIAAAHLYFGLMFIFALVGIWESARIMKMERTAWEYWALFPLAALVFYRYGKLYYFHRITHQFYLPEILAVGLLGIGILTLFRYTQELYTESGKLIFSLVYAVLPFAFALGLPTFILSENTFSIEPFLLFILIWCSDSFAYFVGRLFGKTPMAPKISPKKTWEGYVGGVVFTVLVGAVLEYQVENIRGNWAVIGGLVALFAPLGDLVESFLKRTFGVKDSGNIIPGHGGILDRLDSFMICAPVLYVYFQLIKYL